MSVAERFSAASLNPPLSQLSHAARAELGGVLTRAGAFEDLPGKWQAALLAAEAPSPQLAPAAGAGTPSSAPGADTSEPMRTVMPDGAQAALADRGGAARREDLGGAGPDPKVGGLQT